MAERRRTALLGVVFGYSTTSLTLARNILFVPIYLHSIPLAEYGAWVATGGALALILINDYGLSGVITQRISSTFGGGDYCAVGTLAGSAVAIGAVLSLLLTGVSLALLPLVHGLKGLTLGEAAAVIACFKLAIVANAFGVVGSAASSVLRSLQRAGLSGSIALAAEILNIIVTLAALFRGYGLYAIAYGMLCRSLLTLLASVLGARRVIRTELGADVGVDRRVLRRLLGESSRFFLSSIAMRLQAQANVFVVSWLLGPASAAIYALTVRAHETVSMLVSQINGALVPSVTHLFGSGNLARFRAVLMRLLIAIGALTAFALTVTVTLNEGFVRLWVGPQAWGGHAVSALMALAQLLALLGWVAYDALLAQGLFRQISRYYIIASALQLLVLALLLRFGTWGAPLASAVAAAFWGCAFWRIIVSAHPAAAAELRARALDLIRIVGFSVLAGTLFVTLYPVPASWHGLIAEGLLVSACLLAGYWLSSPGLRSVASDELQATFRALRPG